MNGMTMLELMIAVFLSVFILLSLMSLYFGVQKNILMNAALMNIQNNIRVTSQILRKAVLNAGLVISENPLHSYESPDMKTTTEAFTVRGANSDTVNVITPMKNLNEICVTNTSRFSVGDTLVIDDAKTYDTFIVKDIKNNFIITQDPLQKRYQKNAEVAAYFMDSYYIGKTNRFNRDGSKLYALYVEDIHGRKTELVEGVSNMKISYSVLYHDVLKNVSQSEVSDWSQVRGISITLELTSLNASTLKKEAYVYFTLRQF
jgi:hypothetical protein